jgi:hypothetical protein
MTRIGLAESPPTTVENRVAQIGDLFDLTVPKIAIHTR